MDVKLANRSPSKLSTRALALLNASDNTARPNSTATNCQRKTVEWLGALPASTTSSIIIFPTYNKAIGIAERIKRKNALAKAREGLVCQTNLKNAGRLFRAENRSLKLISFLFFGMSIIFLKRALATIY